jgi:hypothetical protein
VPTGGGALKYTAFRGPMDALLRTYQQEGLRALYGGFGAVIIGGTPGTVLYLTGYAFFRDSLSVAVSTTRRHDEDSGRTSEYEKPTLPNSQEFAVHFMSGMLAETVSCIIYVPVDVVKERMQVQRKVNASSSSGYQYSGSWDALRQITKTEGVRGIYKGYGATLASFGPFSALYFMFYEQCRNQSREIVSRQRIQQKEAATSNKVHYEPVKDGDLPLVHLIACSAGAGALASWLTSPLDMAKLRLQVQRGQAAAAGSSVRSNHTTRYNGLIDCLQSIFAEGGVRGLFRGAGARVIHFAPATTITMTCYEKCRAFFADMLG